nr:nascent polypeptide-associated complex protein [Caldisphaera lagunensis]
MGMNPKDLKKAMKRLGMEIEEVKAEKVTIDETDGSKLIIEDPQVMIIKAKNQPTMVYVVGEPKKVEETKKKEEVSISEEDINLVMEQANVDKETAKKALIESNGDIAEAILKLKGS